MAKEDGDSTKKVKRPIEVVDYDALHVAVIVEWEGAGPYHYERMDNTLFLRAGKGTPETYAGYFCMQPVHCLPVKGMRVYEDTNVVKVQGNARTGGYKGFYKQEVTISRKGLHPTQAQARALKETCYVIKWLRRTLPNVKRIAVNA